LEDNQDFHIKAKEMAPEFKHWKAEVEKLK